MRRLCPLAVSDLFIQIMIKIDVVINPSSSLGCDSNELSCFAHAEENIPANRK